MQSQAKAEAMRKLQCYNEKLYLLTSLSVWHNEENVANAVTAAEGYKAIQCDGWYHLLLIKLLFCEGYMREKRERNQSACLSLCINLFSLSEGWPRPSVVTQLWPRPVLRRKLAGVAHGCSWLAASGLRIQETAQWPQKPHHYSLNAAVSPSLSATKRPSAGGSENTKRLQSLAKATTKLGSLWRKPKLIS